MWSPQTAAEVGLKTRKRKKETASEFIQKTADPLEYWILTGRWPKEYFEQGSQIWEDIEQDSQIREDIEQESGLEMEFFSQAVKYVEVNGFRLPCPLRRKQSDSSFDGPSDEQDRESKWAAYRSPRYTALLEGKGSYMTESKLGVTEASIAWCKTLLDSDQTVPKDSLFRDDLFGATCQKVQNRNEARVIRSISPYIAPSAEDLATFGATHLKPLIEGVNETWTESIAVAGPLSKPDYSVGFRRTAFTDEQLKKLDKLVGSVFDNSFFVATFRMYFPFFTCEVKCGVLDIADRENAHSMTVAVRAVVELYRAVKREEELDRKILAFSISHDHSQVRIYGHYAVIEGDKTSFYRHPIHAFSFAALDGRERWTAYKFTKNVYDHHSIKFHEMICSGIDDLPADLNFDLSSFSQFKSQSSQRPNAESIWGGENTHPSSQASQEVPPTTSFAQATEPASKKPRNQRIAGR